MKFKNYLIELEILKLGNFHRILYLTQERYEHELEISPGKNELVIASSSGLSTDR